VSDTTRLHEAWGERRVKLTCLSWSVWNNQNVRKQEISSSYRSSGNKEGLTSYAKYVSCLILHMSCCNSIPKAGSILERRMVYWTEIYFPYFWRLESPVSMCRQNWWSQTVQSPFLRWRLECCIFQSSSSGGEWHWSQTAEQQNTKREIPFLKTFY
jgi:hypothetical protein